MPDVNTLKNAALEAMTAHPPKVVSSLDTDTHIPGCELYFDDFAAAQTVATYVDAITPCTSVIATSNAVAGKKGLAVLYIEPNCLVPDEISYINDQDGRTPWKIIAYAAQGKVRKYMADHPDYRLPKDCPLFEPEFLHREEEAIDATLQTLRGSLLSHGVHDFLTKAGLPLSFEHAYEYTDAGANKAATDLLGTALGLHERRAYRQEHGMGYYDEVDNDAALEQEIARR